MDGVTFTDFEDRDTEWVLGAIVAGARATLTPERSGDQSEAMLLERARSDFDRYHHQAKGKDRVILAWHQGKRVGMVWITMEMLYQNPGGAWLLEVFVEPPYRRQGLAGELMAQAEGWAREQGAGEIWLNVGGGNRKALGLYESQGFEVETMHLCKRLSPGS
ncbi:MAG: GNAT family N-acetyltransferase [Methanomassiliicoccus sp.]|nr:GNAT family N-acetyltransferase [Methanomassiliicoccus sp.]